MPPRLLEPATQIDRNQKLAGIPIVQITGFLRRVRDTSWFADVVEKAFPGSGQDVLEALIEEGYVDPTSETGIFKVTAKGEALVKWTTARLVSRRLRA